MDRIKVLIVDDDQADRAICRYHLETSGSGTFVFCEESTGAAGLKACESFGPDCILLDYRLPDMDGLTVLRHLQSDSGSPSHPVVMLTAIGSEQIAVDAMKLGLMDYLAKNATNLGLLPRTVENAIRKFRLERKIALQHAELEQRNRDLEIAHRDILREKEKYRSLTEAIPQLVWSASPERLVRHANERFLKYSGRQPGSAWPFSSLVHPEDLERFQDAWSAASSSGGILETEARLKRAADGMFRWHLVRAVPVSGSHAKLDNWFGTCTDIENQKRAEEAVRQQQKFECIGLLAGGIAHDFNNLLVGIMGGASFALESIQADDPIYPMLDVVLKSSKRAAHLVQQLLAYAGKGNYFQEPVNLSRLIQETRELLYTTISESVSLDFKLDPDVPPIEIHSGQLQQLVVNLVINAAEAFGDQPGRVTVKTYVRDVKEPQDYANALGYAILPGRYVGLEVGDTGCGMDEKTRANIFEPFFTTKFTGRGLGLAAVQGIVRSLHGLIDVASTPGNGSVFTVLLPAKGSQEIREQSLILVIDRDDMAARTAKTELERDGYSVLLARDGSAAMEAFRQHRAELGLVLLDMNLEGKSSVQVLRDIRDIDNEIPVLVSCTGSEEQAARHFTGLAYSRTIQKPFAFSQLLDAVARIFAKQGSAPASFR